MTDLEEPPVRQTRLQLLWVWILPRIRPIILETLSQSTDLLFTISITLMGMGLVAIVLSMKFVRILLVGTAKDIGWFDESLPYLMFIGGILLLFYVTDRDPEKKAAVTRFITQLGTRDAPPERAINHHIITVGKVSVAYHLTDTTLASISKGVSSERQHRAAIETKVQEVNTKLTTILTADQKAELTKFQVPLGIAIVAIDSPYLREVPTIPPPEKPKPPRLIV